MSKPKSEIATAQQIAAHASATVSAIDDRLAKLRSAVSALDDRAQPLRDQISELQQQEPMQIGPDPAHIDALLSNPAARPDQGEITAAISAARKQEDVRQMTIATVQAAIDKLTEERVAIEADIAELGAERASRWYDFASAAADYLAAAFRSEFTRLRDELIAPLVALSHIRDAEGKIVLPIGSALATLTLDRGTLTMRKWQSAHGGGGNWSEDKLFQEVRHVDAREAADTVERFRSALPAIDSSAGKAS